jgi:hypothetical protein
MPGARSDLGSEMKLERSWPMYVAFSFQKSRAAVVLMPAARTTLWYGEARGARDLLVVGRVCVCDGGM